MKELKFSIEYDYDIDTIVTTISECLGKVGYEIDFDEDAEERDDGIVDYVIKQIV